MIINNVLNNIQTLLKPIYERSFVLQNIDWLIGLNIFLVIIFSTFAQSDNIGYFAIFAILLTIVKLFTKTGEFFELSLGDKLLLVYFLCVIISVAGSSLLYLSLKGFFKTLTYLGFYISVVHYLKDNKDKIKYIFLTILVCTFCESIVAFLQNFASVQEISGWQDMSRLNPEEVMTRVYGTLKPYNPNLFGGYMLACIPAFLTLPFWQEKFLYSKKSKTTLLCISLIFGFLSVSALVLTGCRGAYIGLFFEIVTLILILYKRLNVDYKKIFSAFVGVCTLIISFVILSVSALRARIFSIFAMRRDSSNSFRFNVYNSCINMFRDNWVLGIGCGNQNFREIYGLYMKTGFDALSAYNIYLEIAVESGIFALISFVSFLCINLIRAVKFVLKSKTVEGVYVISALISIVGILFHGIVDTVFFRPQIQFVFWIMIGVIRVLVK